VRKINAVLRSVNRNQRARLCKVVEECGKRGSLALIKIPV
jgi:hypothetical protein